MDDVYFSDGLDLLPAGPDIGNNMYSGTSADAYGSYIQFLASASEDLYIVRLASFTSYLGINLHYGQYKIAIGAAGSEVVKAVVKNVNLWVNSTTGNVYSNLMGSISIPRLKIPSGSRIAVSAADGISSQVIHYVTLFYLPVSKVVNPVLDEVVSPNGTVVADGGNTATTFKTSLSGPTDCFADAFLKFKTDTTTANLRNQVKKISAFNTSTLFITMDKAFTQTPAAGDTFDVINR